MNEIYRLLVNVHEIVKANNLYLSSLEARIAELEKRMTIDLPESSGPDASGAENQTNIQ